MNQRLDMYRDEIAEILKPSWKPDLVREQE